MCDCVVDNFVVTLKFVADWFVTNKMIEKLDNSVFSNADIFFRDVDSNISTLFRNDVGFNTIDFNNINLDDDNFDEDDPETNNYVRLMTWHNRFEQLKACKKEISKELIPVAWLPTKWCNWCDSEDEKKK